MRIILSIILEPSRQWSIAMVISWSSHWITDCANLGKQSDIVSCLLHTKLWYVGSEEWHLTQRAHTQHKPHRDSENLGRDLSSEHWILGVMMCVKDLDHDLWWQQSLWCALYVVMMTLRWGWSPPPISQCPCPHQGVRANILCHVTMSHHRDAWQPPVPASWHPIQVLQHLNIINTLSRQIPTYTLNSTLKESMRTYNLDF